MHEFKHKSGFILPIVVVLMGVMGLLWGAAALDASDERQRQQQLEIEGELLFWHKALVAFALYQDRGVSSFNELLQFYSLERPEYKRLDGSVVTFSNKPTFQNIVELLVSNLPAETADYYKENFTDGIVVARSGDIIFPAVPIDDWKFTENLIRREGVTRAELLTDVDVGGHALLNVASAYSDELVANAINVPNSASVGSGRSTAVDATNLIADQATLGGLDVVDLMTRLAAFNEQLSLCLAPAGPCHN